MHVRKNDRVIIIAGRDKGKVGKVLRVMPEVDRVVVEGINKVKRHTKPNQQNQQGGIIEKEAPLHASNVALVAKDGRPTRAGYKIEGETKTRISRRTGEEI
jgi:large subunit ribosomal protein L24